MLNSLLKTLYRNAQALIYTSRYEGFGLPTLEPMECQCPVIFRLTSSLSELVGDAASLFEPDSVDGLVNTMEIVVEDSEHRASID
ncbi:MAG: glycosyltransferase family 4 protein [Moorea sp. SIO3I6]|uniref:glycosyltransferase n=1 Tax=Moorena sp. SIO4A5 TaxID=2607838 RepID=UPI0013C9EB30|nr:glycosyltransferase family 4 protein [Moorena sp. SIO4A5]NEP23823.1 glycosyltransferase family 4 protein [Moorena sp. SIO3I6]NEQ59664.1 glycosyltransferase family 4 protein [Moorena sp. SIO4A1]